MSSAPVRIEPAEAHAEVKTGEASLIDVRGFDEYAALRAEGAVCIPLADLERRAGEIPTHQPVYFICATGGRSQMAVDRLRALGMQNVSDVIGGTQAWHSAGLPTHKQKGVIPLERQVRGVAGFLVFVFSVLGFAVNTAFFWGALFIGFMLTFTAIVGICPMMSLLKLMPWNRVAADTCSIESRR